MKISEKTIACYRPVKENFVKARIFPDLVFTIGTFETKDIVPVKVMAARNLTNGHSIIHLDVFENNNFFSLISQGIFTVFELNRMEVISTRRIFDYKPKKWQAIQLNCEKVK